MPNLPSKIISLDTETTGIDSHHGASPFLVTICSDDKPDEPDYWEWDVDPLTRKVLYNTEDVNEIRQSINASDSVVLHNAKFDIRMLAKFDPEIAERWNWETTKDTLLAGHLLASNQPHDLTTMALIYLGINIEPFEVKLKEATQQARREAPKDWAIAREGRKDMPSAKEKVWKFDTWLPRMLARHLELPPNHEWHTVLSDYATTDSYVTLAMFKVLIEQIKERGLEAIYATRLKILPIAFKMENHGVTINTQRTAESIANYSSESNALGDSCKLIAKSAGFDLTLPKSGTNKSLLEVSERLIVDELKEFNEATGSDQVPARTDTGRISLNKQAIGSYLTMFRPNGKAGRFLKSLTDKRSRDTAITYLNSYARFWRPTVNPMFYKLYPFLNPTGTHTLRWSSSNPNEQNISKKEGFNLRYCFGPAPGREWYSLDAQNIELRIPAYEAVETEMINLFEHPDDPPYYGSNHLLNFHTVYPEIWEKVLDEVGLEKVGPTCKKRFASSNYQWVKNGGFGVQYGAVDITDPDVWGTADKAFHKKGSHTLLKERFKRIHGKGGLNDKCIIKANEDGYVETIPDATVDPDRGYPLLCTRTTWGRILPTVPLNYHVQGTAMWWMMKAMIRCEVYLNEVNSDRKPSDRIHLVMQVHDELVFDFPIGDNLEHVKQIQSLMAQGGEDIGIPTPVSIEYHPNNWSEGKTI